jgi:GNAT superfamily N-acetyltransferase
LAESLQNLQIARAGIEAIPEVHALILEAAQWLIAKGEPLWGEPETSGEELARVARAGELVTGRVGGALCACMYLHNEDPIFWPNVGAGEALYIHRLAVARRFAGHGYSHALLDWAAREARSTGRDFLRLDCEPRPKLLSLYRDAGFLAVDATPIQVGIHFVVRHQKPLTPRSPHWT